MQIVSSLYFLINYFLTSIGLNINLNLDQVVTVKLWAPIVLVFDHIFLNLNQFVEKSYINFIVLFSHREIIIGTSLLIHDIKGIMSFDWIISLPNPFHHAINVLISTSSLLFFHIIQAFCISSTVFNLNFINSSAFLLCS
jgi:hypothetical protein